ncbi:MAG: hypothetical protein EAZ25_26730 [Oscillatoriales cyanobacterium]|nr:MAG: hypothetical protein EAZ88_23495 [Oscillatoriales cyanobacterium]TAE65192.1 MAG: hypothetical protein EAZ86_25250 [Oscillatoriales cyanobacterium]TAF86951.1 MAG: hypothetical protein EAZ49_21635 [Oscillatoriales cyanobacterium]TAG62735.1 MAG: hypothetical protein EAZ25_26730 [Oscillatoriales cyanobacterium]TAH26239.1 MAG: hypothetical protein EAZ10_10170 [Oscillatoriales cyanobacterium]
MYGWSETGFLREYLVTVDKTPKNPVSWVGNGCSETGFLREYLVTVDKTPKNPASLVRNALFS